MGRLHGRSDFEHGRAVRTGVLLVNLGTPQAPTTRAVRRYLAEFLSDPRVVELPRWLWLPLLYGVILNIRPRRSAHAYQRIWGSDGAPLLSGSRRLLAGLESRLKQRDDTLVFALGMRYGEPAIATAIDALIAAEARRILIVPLYPQYASATTASVYDAVFAHCRQLRWVPELRFVADYHDDPGYISALAQSVRTHWAKHGRGERLLMSFHGIPEETFRAGDPYYCQCQASARLLAQALALGEADWQLSFQSRVGPKPWLQPYTDHTLQTWAQDGVGDIDVICPGFAVDCLETLEEIAMLNADAYRAAGGGTLRYIPALNDDPMHLDALEEIIDSHLGGWRERSQRAMDARVEAAQRARAAGAR